MRTIIKHIKKKDLTVLTIVIFSILYILLSLLYIHRTSTPPHWDMSRHLWASLNYNNNIHLSLDGFKNIFRLYFYYPPMVYVFTKPFYFFLGSTLYAAILSNLIWITTLFVSTYYLGKYYFNKYVGLTAVMIIACTPMIIGQSHEYQLDLPLTAVSALTWCLLIYSNNFNNLWTSFLLGAAITVGFLTKWMFPVFIITPLLITIVLSLAQMIKNRNYRILINISIAGIIPLVFAGKWYWKFHQYLTSDFFASGVNAGKNEGDPQRFTASIIWYFKHLTGDSLFIPLSIMLAVGLLLMIRKSRLQRYWHVIAILAIPVVVFSLIPNKDIRYIMPILVPSALIISYWPFEFKGHLKTTFITCLVVISALNFLLLHIEYPKISSNIQFTAGGMLYNMLSNTAYTSGYPSATNYHISDVITVIKNYQPVCADNTSAAIAIAGNNTRYSNYYTYAYAGLKERNQLIFEEGLNNWPRNLLIAQGSQADIFNIIKQTKIIAPNVRLEIVYQTNLPEGNILEIYSTDISCFKNKFNAR